MIAGAAAEPVERARGRVLGLAMEDHVSKIVKGLFVALALVAVLEREPDPKTTALALIGATIAVIVAELYGLALEGEIKRGRHLTLSEVGRIAADLSFIALGAAPPTIFFILAWAGAIEASTAAVLAVWSGLGMLIALGLIAGRVAGRPWVRSLVYSVVLGLLGVIIIVIKTIHH